MYSPACPQSMALSPSTMNTIDLEDLISTLDTHHIGTEQLDLANLQAQLQQALQGHTQPVPFPASPVQVTCSHVGGAPANTPTARTPSWSHFAEATHLRKRRSNSMAGTRTRSRDVILEEDEVRWHHTDGNRTEMEQDNMEDVDEEAEVDASLSNPLHSSHSPTYDSSPSTYASMDPFLAAQLQAAEQRRHQPSFFAQVATAQQHTSPFYSAAQRAQQFHPAPTFAAHTAQGEYLVPGTPAQEGPVPLKIDTACMQ